ncbi:Hypothetical protein HVR_LOCUS162 [uncultured virus]|nr:Hypothetical protein HVR_LOCUS162 [uncultured virus]
MSTNANTRIVEITDLQEEAVFTGNNPLAVIFFGSIRCSHCRSMTPVYEKLSNKYLRVAFGHVETSLVEVDDLDGVPTFVAYKQGTPVNKVLGAGERALINMIESLIK